MSALPYEVEVGRCPWPVRDCDICRNSVERGLCGKWVNDDWDESDLDDAYDYDWDES